MSVDFRIAQVCLARGLEADAVQALILSRALAEAGCHPVVVAGPDTALAREAVAAGLEVVTVSWDGWTPLRGWRLAGVLKCLSVTVVHAHGDEALSVVDWAARFGKFRTVATWRRATAPVSACARRFKRCAAAAAVGAGAKAACAAAGIPGVAEVFDAVEPGTPSPSSDALRERFREAYAPDVKKPLWLVHYEPRIPSVADQATLRGMLDGQTDLLLCLEKILPKLPQTRLVLAGPLCVADPDENALVFRARERALDDTVIFAGTEWPEEELAGLADVFVRSDRERYGEETASVARAMASEAAVAAAGGGALAAWVEDGKTGRLTPSGEVPALAAAISQLLEERPLRGHYGRAGLALARRRGPKAALAQWLPLYGR